jgi:hypothetical protein
MKRSALPLVLGVYGRVRMCRIPSSRSALRNSPATYPDPLFVITRSTWIPRALNQRKALTRKAVVERRVSSGSTST